MALLEVRNVTRRFGGVVALDDVSLALEEGELVGLVGPNGAGKTTLLDVITRRCRPDSGTIELGARSLRRTPPHRVVRRGIARTFQHGDVFETMTALENVVVGARARTRPFQRPTVERRARELLDRLEVGDAGDRRVGGLPRGTQKRVALARALAAQPRLLLLDEPAAGLGHDDVAALAASIAGMRDDFGLTILLAEHHLELALGVADRIHVLDSGRTIADAKPREVRHDPAVLEAYLGADAAAA